MKRIPADVRALILVIAVCLGFAAIILHRQHVRAKGDPADVVRRFIVATDRGDQRQVALCLSSESLAQAGRADGDKTQAISPVGKKMAKFALKIVSNDGNSAKVVMKSLDGLALKRNSRYYIRGPFKDGVPYLLVNESGSWKLDMVKTEKLWFASKPQS